MEYSELMDWLDAEELLDLENWLDLESWLDLRDWVDLEDLILTGIVGICSCLVIFMCTWIHSHFKLYEDFQNRVQGPQNFDK